MRSGQRNFSMPLLRRSFFVPVSLCALQSRRFVATSGAGSAIHGKPSGERVEAKAERHRVTDDPPPIPQTAKATNANAETTSTRILIEDPVADDAPQTPADYDPWKVLGLNPGAPAYEIRLRYHDLMKECHPSLAPEAKVDLNRVAEVDRAFALVMAMPTLDTQFVNVVSKKQRVYYQYLPEWMARNVDDTPRWYGWLRYRVPSGVLIFLVCALSYMVGRIVTLYPVVGPVFVVALLSDYLLATSAVPAVTVIMLFKMMIAASSVRDMAWLFSPKGFLQGRLEY